MNRELLHRTVELLPVLIFIGALIYAVGRLRLFIDEHGGYEDGEL